MLIKILAIAFALVGLRRVLVRFRRGGALTLELLVWSAIWAGIGLVVFIPHRTDRIAQFIGVSTGFNALTFISVTGLLFAVYRLYNKMQRVERDLTRIIRAQAIDNATPVADTPPASAP